MTAQSTLILGGARSGKTRRALDLGARFADRFYIATGEARDAEMAERIAHHRRERGGSWITVEAPLDLPAAIAAVPGPAAAVVDCLTLWLSNVMGAGRDTRSATDTLLGAIRACPATLVIVSNEVGLGLVPETPLGRAFRDEQGRLNQAVAAAVQEVEFVVAGLSLKLK